MAAQRPLDAHGFIQTDKQTQAHVPRHEAINGMRSENKQKRGEKDGKNYLSLSLLPALPRWPCLWFPAGACFHPAIPPLSRSSPEMEHKRVKILLKKRNHSTSVTGFGHLENSHHVVYAFRGYKSAIIYGIHPEVNELPGDVFFMQTYGSYKQMSALTLKRILTMGEFRSITGRQVGWKTNCGVSWKAAVSLFLNASAEAACES